MSDESGVMDTGQVTGLDTGQAGTQLNGNGVDSRKRSFNDVQDSSAESPSPPSKQPKQTNSNAKPSHQLSADEVRQITQSINEHRDKLLDYFLSDTSEVRKSMRTAVIEMCDAHNKLATAYLNGSAVNDFASDCKVALNEVCEVVKKVSDVVADKLTLAISEQRK
ncbi:hypothetical protein QAD02_007717 [Eretmocerus hayati]|uniref:Uncharacterized protein n=1 Tax=Eretmocerus hayati TaxID=131215 RepID=A0ACC2N4G1_9HYME|nr:hypothetical protein QAD02_007717 [Eretmocerus hayati]